MIKTIVAGFMAFSLSAVLAADKENRLEYYQREIKNKETGVYPHDGDLYLHVKLSYGKGERADFKRIEANKTLKDMLRSWAISYAESKQQEVTPDPDGVAFAKQIVGKYYPQWNYGAWMFRGAVQSPVPDTSNGFYVGGMIVSEKEVTEQIPEGFYKRGTEDDLFKGTRLVVRVNLTKGGDNFLKECGACDLCPGEDGREALAEIDEKVSGYLKDSVASKKLQSSITKIETPLIAEDYAEEIEQDKPVKTLSVFTCTNRFDSVAFETNTTERAQTVAEIKRTGYAKGAQVTEVAISCDEYEIIETTTQVVVTVARRVHKKVKKSTQGVATFEKSFLSGFTATDRPAVTTKIGKIALERIEKSPGDKANGRLLKSALQENPYDKNLWIHYGAWFANTKDFVAAAVCFRRALSLDSRSEPAMMGLCETYKKMGYKKQSFGLAFIARGLSDDDDIIQRAESILKGR